MLARIGWYLLFLIVYALYSLVVSYGQQRQKRVLVGRKGSAFITNQVVIISGLIPIVLIPWILTGFFSKVFLLSLLVAFELSVLLIYFSYSTSSTTPREITLRFTLWAAELTLKHPVIVAVTVAAFGLLILGGYFITSTYIYFANPLGSQHAVRGILSVSTALYLVGTIFISASTIAQIASPLITNGIRRALFFSQAANALPMGVILTVYLGLMGMGSKQLLPQTLQLRPEFSQYLPLVILVVFYLIILIIPYFVGLEGRRRIEIGIYRKSLTRIMKVIDAVGVPSDQDADQLTKLRQELKQEEDDLKASEPIFQLAEESENPSSTEAADLDTELVYDAYRHFKDQDPRFINLDAIRALDRKLEEMISEYTRVGLGANRLELSIELGRSLEGHFRDQRQYFEGRIKSAEDMKVLTPVLARLVGVLGAAPVVLQYGQRIIKLLPISQ